MANFQFNLDLLPSDNCTFGRARQSFLTINKSENIIVMTETNKFAHAAMMIRKPVEQVFMAFTNPEITTKFWFTKSTGPLEKGRTVDWTWEMYDHTVPVHVLKLITNNLLLVEMGTGEHKQLVEWDFKVLDDYSTFVSITNTGFKGTPDEILSGIRDSTGGFSWVLAGLKAYLEHGVELNLVADRYPKELGEH